jgi:hypothetical protein
MQEPTSIRATCSSDETILLKGRHQGCILVTLHPIEEPTSIRAIYQQREILLKPDNTHTSMKNKQLLEAGQHPHIREE